MAVTITVQEQVRGLAVQGFLAIPMCLSLAQVELEQVSVMSIARLIRLPVKRSVFASRLSPGVRQENMDVAMAKTVLVVAWTRSLIG